MIVIVDYGMGNLGSLANMVRKANGQCVVSGDPALVQTADKIILPGVGAFDAAMSKIDSRGLRSVLDSKVLREGCPVLGVCLGMQLLTTSSEEGTLPGLDWIPARVIRFRPTDRALKVPHMGWNTTTQIKECPLTRMLPEDPRFYFVHSYHVHADDPLHSVLRTTHGVEFDAMIQRDNVFGVQFHPEKSHRYGLSLIRAFVEL